MLFACPACLPECDMKFRFCGGEDCPEWLGAEIATIAKVSSVRIRLLAKKIVQVYVSASKGLDENEARKAADKLKGNSDGLSDGDVSAIFAVLHHVITSAAKFDVDATTLSLELQQLGLPRELSDALVRPYSEARSELRDAGTRKTLRFPPLKVLEALGSSKISGGGGEEEKEGVVCKIGSGGQDTHTIVMSRAKLDVLIHEVQQAQAKLQDIV